MKIRHNCNSIKLISMTSSDPAKTESSAPFSNFFKKLYLM